MPSFELIEDGRRRRSLAALAGIAVALAAAPVAHAGLPAHQRQPAAAASGHTDGTGPILLALADDLPARLSIRSARPHARGPSWTLRDLGRSAPPWLPRVWSLGLAVRPAPAALFTFWLTGGVHQVLGWIVPAMPARDRDDARARDEILASITVEPVVGAETSSYGYRRDPFTRRRKMHKGVDYRAPRGTPVYAAGPGVVEVARRKSGYGRVVMIDHGEGVETRYAHLQTIEVEPGERVLPGMRIGTVGSTGRATGPHLHFELRIDGEAHDPLQVLGPLLSVESLGDAPGHHLGARPDSLSDDRSESRRRRALRHQGAPALF